MSKRRLRGWVIRVLIPASTLLALGGCPLTDQQLTSVYAGVLSSGLSAILNVLINSLAGGTGTTA